jgi:hypothetical protein
MCFEGDVWSMVLSMIRGLGLQDKDNKFERHELRLQENQVRVLMLELGSLEMSQEIF